MLRYMGGGAELPGTGGIRNEYINRGQEVADIRQNERTLAVWLLTHMMRRGEEDKLQWEQVVMTNLASCETDGTLMEDNGALKAVISSTDHTTQWRFRARWEGRSASGTTLNNEVHFLELSLGVGN